MEMIIDNLIKLQKLKGVEDKLNSKYRGYYTCGKKIKTIKIIPDITQCISITIITSGDININYIAVREDIDIEKFFEVNIQPYKLEIKKKYLVFRDAAINPYELTHKMMTGFKIINNVDNAEEAIIKYYELLAGVKLLSGDMNELYRSHITGIDVTNISANEINKIVRKYGTKGDGLDRHIVKNSIYNSNYIPFFRDIINYKK